MSGSANIGWGDLTKEAEADVVKVFQKLHDDGVLVYSSLVTEFHGSGDVPEVVNNLPPTTTQEEGTGG